MSTIESAGLTATVDAYVATWNATDAAERAELVERAWAATGRFVDPQADATGHDGIERVIVKLQRAFPEHEIRRTSGIDVHHDQVRYGWEMCDAAGNVVVAGLDVATLADDGRLQQVVGFFGELPPA